MTDLCTEYKCSKETKRGNTKIKEIDIFETSVVAPSINDLFRLFGQVNFAKDVFLPQSSLSTYDYDCFILLNSQKQQMDGKAELKTSTSEQPNEHAFASSIDIVDPHQQNKYPTKNTVVLLSQHGHVLKCGENRTHLIPSIHSKCSAEAKGTILFSSIVVSIVFYGSYISKPSSVPSTTEEECSTPSSYHPGSLHATLLSSRKRRVYHNSINNELDNDYQELEKCPNTSTSLGKLVFCYRPRTKVVVTDDTGNSFFGRIVDPTATWVMHVEGLANPYTAYSITALAVDECYTISHVHRHISSFLKSQESLLVACHQKLSLLNEEESLEKRKLQLLTKVLLADSHMQRVRCEEDMKKISMPVKDVENNTEGGSPDDDRKGLEIEYIHWCRLIALRTHEATRIKEQIRTLISNQKHITREENSIIDLCNQLGFQLSDIESIMQFSNQVVVSNCSEKNAVEKKATWDPFLAPCVRARPPSEWSLKDAEWISIDQILNPQLWDKQQRFIPVKRIGTSDDSWDDNSSTKEIKSLRREMSLRKWSCPFTNKQHIISIWKNNNVDLMNDDERICHNLLVEYNGPCVASYDDGYTQDLLKSNRLFHGSRWENSSHCLETNLCSSKSLLLQDDLWQRCRLLYRELKKTFLCTTTFVECCLLHGVPQRFSTPMLRLELGRELDKTLLEILNRKEDYASNSFFSDMKGLNTGIKQTFVAKRCDVSSSRIHRRNYGREGPVKLCRACRSPQCCWKHFVDMDGMKQLKQILVTELTGVQQQSNTLFLESRVARSARNGGTTWFNKKDLLYELESEIFDMERKIRFERVDKELHDCLASTGTIVEIEALHGYKALLSRDHAIAALKHEHTKLAANTAAREIVDEILNWMLEGWYFGERPTRAIVRSMNQASMNDIESIKITSKTAEITEITAIPKEKTDLETKAKSLNFGIFLATYMYFQALYLLKQLKCTWSGTHEAKAHEHMILSSINMRARDTVLKTLHEKSKLNIERKRNREEIERAIAVRKLHERVWKAKKHNMCATSIQKRCRSHVERRAWKVLLIELKAANADANAATAKIAQKWRSHRKILKESHENLSDYHVSTGGKGEISGRSHGFKIWREKLRTSLSQQKVAEK